MKFRKGNIVVMTEEALDNYGEKFRDVELLVTACSNKYMPSKEFFASGKPEGYHPGYDEGVSPMGLYDLKIKETGEELPFSLYDWELKTVWL
jgi:hypothetical protein